MVGQLCGYAEGQIDSGDDETLCEQADGETDCQVAGNVDKQMGMLVLMDR